ncbi:achaete-scute complex protein T4 [Rhipicephalus sanguineus]|uniref:achaete-scute complex protein T4 n=1 Tax=Rhipicephalus sanguineus TaxID=34632 RepID=UPI0018934638|nr:achaete-scute complex protein T4 [Rhipicephalus sanguineus]
MRWFLRLTTVTNWRLSGQRRLSLRCLDFVRAMEAAVSTRKPHRPTTLPVGSHSSSRTLRPREAVRTVADLVPIKNHFSATTGVTGSDADPTAVVVSSTSTAAAGSGSCGGGVKRVSSSHREKPPHLVARRNARERRRVQAVNSAFCRLRKCVPIENRAKRLSKVKTLHKAIEYIYALQDLLDKADEDAGVTVVPVPNTVEVAEPLKSEPPMTKHKGSEPSCDQQRWINLENVDRVAESYQGFVNFYEQFPTAYAT